METFAHSYILLKDTPTHKAGRTVKWRGGEDKFYFRAISEWKHDNGKEGIYLDLQGPSFTLEEVKNTEWWKPEGKEVVFIPPFPSRKEIEEYVYLEFETRLTSDVDVCRTLQKLFSQEKFAKNLYDFVKKEYEEFYSLTNNK